MEKAIANITKNPLMLAGGVVLIIGFVYLLGRQTVKDVANVAAGAVSGNNAITQNQTNADGEKVTAYEGRGVLGTIGAVFNSASGGIFASAGEALGQTIYDWTHNDENVGH